MSGRTVLLSDHTIASLSGSSQKLLGQDMTRNIVLINNTGANNVGVNLVGGTAAIGGAGTITIVPNGTLLLDVCPPGNAVNIIGTSGQPCACFTDTGV